MIQHELAVSLDHKKELDFPMHAVLYGAAVSERCSRHSAANHFSDAGRKHLFRFIHFKLDLPKKARNIKKSKAAVLQYLNISCII